MLLKFIASDAATLAAPHKISNTDTSKGENKKKKEKRGEGDNI
jgi:hypothetical protein